MDAGTVGGIVGGLVGVIGGAVGTYCSVRNSQGPVERVFMIKASVVVWIAVILFLALMFLLPNPHRYWLWVPYGVLLPLGIRRINKGVANIREAERDL
jgi:hypothetical protein